MAKWIAAEKTRAGLRHAVICPNVTGRTEDRIAQCERVRADSLDIVHYSSGANLYPPGVFCCYLQMTSFCLVSSSSFCFP